MLTKNRLIACAMIALIPIIAVISYILISLDGVWAKGAAQDICNNLIEEQLLDSAEHCFVSSNHEEYLLEMFPEGTTVDFVEKGMQGFYLDTNNYGPKQTLLFYYLRKTPITRLGFVLPIKRATFRFNSSGELYDIDFEFPW